MNGVPFQGGNSTPSLASTNLTDSSNLARLNAANTFTAVPQTIALTATYDTGLAVKNDAGQTIFSVGEDGNKDASIAVTDHTGSVKLQIGAGGGTNGAVATNGGSFTVYPNGIGGNPSIRMSGGYFDYFQSVPTVAWGIPAIYGSGRATGETASNANVAKYTVGGADGSFIISANINVTTTGTFTLSCSCTYTDETNTSRTQVFNFSTLTGTFATTLPTSVASYAGVPLRIRAKATTDITIITTATRVSGAWNVEGDIIQVK